MDFDKESKVAIGFLDENEDSSDEKETNKELKVEYIDAKWNDFVFFYDRNYGQNGQTVFIERIHHLFNTIYSAS
jgi:hypothetical protein